MFLAPYFDRPVLLTDTFSPDKSRLLTKFQSPDVESIVCVFLRDFAWTVFFLSGALSEDRGCSAYICLLAFTWIVFRRVIAGYKTELLFDPSSSLRRRFLLENLTSNCDLFLPRDPIVMVSLFGPTD